MDHTNLLNQTALLFEGGGMRASYTSGMVVALLEEGIYAPFVAGISAGASNTVNYLSCDAPRARTSFTDFAADPNFGDWRTFVRGKGLFHSEYIYEHSGLPGMPLQYNWESFQQNPADFRIGAFDITSGHTAWWGRKDTPELPDLMRRVRASSTMPIAMPAVPINGRTYVDGALGTDGGIPITVAEELGYERFVVILTQEREYRKVPEKFPRFYLAYFRKYPAVADALLTRWWRYNQTREKLFELQRAGKAYLFIPEVMPVANGERNVKKLNAAHKQGLAQARREMPAIKEFLGLA